MTYWVEFPDGPSTVRRGPFEQSLEEVEKLVTPELQAKLVVGADIFEGESPEAGHGTRVAVYQMGLNIQSLHPGWRPAANTKHKNKAVGEVAEVVGTFLGYHL